MITNKLLKKCKNKQKKANFGLLKMAKRRKLNLISILYKHRN